MTRGRKWGLIGSAVAVAAALGYVALGSFGDSLVYFYTPSEVVKLSADFHDRKIRVGGMVEPGSMTVVPQSLEIGFRLGDGETTIPVVFEGVPPDLFKDGQGAVVEGNWSGSGVFRADFIMAKHSEEYMPIEMKRDGKAMPKEDWLRSLRN